MCFQAQLGDSECVPPGFAPLLIVLFSLRSSHSCLAHTSRGSRCPRVCLISSMHGASVHSSTLNNPFHSYSFSHSSSTSCYLSTSTRSSSKITCATSPRRWGQLTSPSPTQVMSPRTTTSRRLMSSPSQSP